MKRVLALIPMLFVASLPGFAREWPSLKLRGSLAEPAPCSCRAPGAQVAVGGETCLSTPSGHRRAQCVMVLNNTSWEISTESCGSTAALRDQGSRAARPE